MTREKAIETLSIIKAYEIDNFIRGAEDREAIEMAIKALEQEPCEDCISRQAVIDAIEKTKSAITTDGEIYVAKINAEMNVQQLPPVTPQLEKHTENTQETHACDLINRDETLTAFADYVGSGMSMNDFDALWDIVVKMPPVQPYACDCISREQAINAIENEQKKIMRSDWAIDQAKFSAMSEIRALIADLPSVGTEEVEE